MLTDRKSAVGDCWNQLVQCSAVLGLELGDATGTGQLYKAYCEIHYLEGPLQILDAAMEANDLAEIRVARDQLRAQHAATLDFFDVISRDIVNRMLALKRALDETTDSMRVLAATYGDTATNGLSTEEQDALAAGVALASAPPGTQMNYRGVTMSIGKPA